MKKFFQENRNISIIAIAASAFCIIVSILKSSKTCNVPYWLYHWGELGYWISVSIIAAAIFFVFQTYIPAQKAEYLNRPSVAIAYRKLQLMLVRLDDLFVEPYKKITNTTSVDLSVERFYHPEFLKDIFKKFDLTQDSPCAYMDNPTKHMSFDVYLKTQWEQAKSFAKDALLTPYAQTDPELSYQLEALLSESLFDMFFDLRQNGQCIDYSCVLSLNQPDTVICKNKLENIIALHKIAFSLYDTLKGDQRLKNIYAPPFYS